jgi:predicted RNA polymerase sigma factor
VEWAEIVAPYGLLEVAAPSPMVSLNRAVAIGMLEGHDRALAVLDAIPLSNHLKRSRLFEAYQSAIANTESSTWCSSDDEQDRASGFNLVTDQPNGR